MPRLFAPTSKALDLSSYNQATSPSVAATTNAHLRFTSLFWYPHRTGLSPAPQKPLLLEHHASAWRTCPDATSWRVSWMNTPTFLALPLDPPRFEHLNLFAAAESDSMLW